jgi:hypothetical protein
MKQHHQWSVELAGVLPVHIDEVGVGSGPALTLFGQ